MTYPARYGSVASNGDLNGIVAGSTVAGAKIPTGGIALGTLSCLFTVDAETNTLTVAGKWQVSDDDVNWYDLEPVQNPAHVVLATGTAGADAPVSKALEAPLGYSGWKFVRPALLTGVVTGAAGDTWVMKSNFRKFNGFE